MKWIIILVTVIQSFPTLAIDYPVSTLAQFEGVLKKVKAGDVIVWKNGTYKDLKINFQPLAFGSEGKMISLRAQTPGKVILKGSSQIFLSGQYLKVEGFLFEGLSTLGNNEDVISFRSKLKSDQTASHSRVTNCAVINYAPAIDTINNNWIALMGVHNEVDHCSFSGKPNQGPYLVVRYQTGKDYVPGSESAPSTYHRIHHNYFGYRTMPTDNGGEDMRIGDSRTSFTKGFNIIEYNYFEDHRKEPEVISNKSCDNIYRFNHFVNNDGALVLRHGNRCVVYGNLIHGKTGRGYSGGLRIIGEQHTVFNNQLTDLEGGGQEMKAPITIMSGLVNTPLNGYYPANDALICFNTVMNSVGPIIRIGVGNKSKGVPFVAPKGIVLMSNFIFGVRGSNRFAAIIEEGTELSVSDNNWYTGEGIAAIQGFNRMDKSDDVDMKPDFIANSVLVDSINNRLVPHKLKLKAEEISTFDRSKVPSREETGVSWKLKN